MVLGLAEGSSGKDAVVCLFAVMMRSLHCGRDDGAVASWNDSSVVSRDDRVVASWIDSIIASWHEGLVMAPDDWPVIIHLT